MKAPYTLVLCLWVILWGCQQQGFQPDSIEQDYITFGKGGGMTNQVDTYYILCNGKVYHHNNLTATYTPLDRLDQPTRTQCFAQAQALPPSGFGCKEPGNIYYFLSIHSDTVQTCVWGSQDFTPPAEINSFYQYVRQLTSKEP